MVECIYNPTLPQTLNKLSKCFTSLCVIITNSCLAVLGLNVILWVCFSVSDTVSEYQKRRNFDPKNVRSSIAQLNTIPPKLIPKHLNLQSMEKIESKRLKNTLREFNEFLATPTVYYPYINEGEPPFLGTDLNVSTHFHGFSFRTPINQRLRPPQPNKLDIFLFGGSTIFGYYLPYEYTIGAHLKENLTKSSEKFGEIDEIRVINFGGLHYSWEQSLILFERVLHANLVPDIAIFFNGAHAIENRWHTRRVENQHREIWEKSQYGIPNLPPATNSVMRLVRMIQLGLEKQKLKKLFKDRYESESQSDSPAVLLEDYLKSKNLLRNLANRFQIKSMFIWQPSAAYLCGTNKRDAKDELLSRLYMITSEHVEDGFHNWSHACSELDGNKFVDGFHYSPKMHQYLGNRLAKTIISESVDSTKENFSTL